MLHAGPCIQLRVNVGCCPLDLMIPPGLEDGRPFSFRVMPGMFHQLNWLAAHRANQILTDGTAAKPLAAASRPTRSAVSHMRMVQALDGRLAGASHRSIAEAIFGEVAVRRRWSADGELRAQARYLVRRSMSLASGDYLGLVGPKPVHPGHFNTASDSP
jgi:hypothetical protein